MKIGDPVVYTSSGVELLSRDSNVPSLGSIGRFITSSRDSRMQMRPGYLLHTSFIL